MKTSWERAIEDLAEWLTVQPGIVVPFVGAGVSRAVGAPTWRELAYQMLDVCGGFELATESEIRDLRSQDPLSILTECEKKLGKDVFFTQVNRALKPASSAKPPQVAELLWEVNPSLIVTTNLDDVMVRAGNQSDMPAKAVSTGDVTPNVFRHGGRHVLHLHGTANDYSSWVMTRSQYDSAIKSNKSLSTIFNTLLLERMFLFVGYSCDDYDFNIFLEQFKENFPVGSLQHYALVSDPSEADRKRLLEYGIFPIAYSPTNNHSAVKSFVEELLNRHKPQRVLRQVSAAHQNVGLLPVAYLKDMSTTERRNRLDQEFRELYLQTKDHALAGQTKLPAPVEARRGETLDFLAASWQVGTTPPHNAIDGLDVVDQLGRGGFGVVWKVEDIKSREPLALKVAHFQETDNYMFVERFKQGIRAMRLLTAAGVKNVVRYRGEREVPLYILMDYVDGGDLSLLNNWDLDLTTRLRLICEISEIIVEAHKIRVVHRDLKPSNVLLKWDEEGQPHCVLSDFDLAWYEGAITKTSHQVGDQAFASPEQLKDGRAVKAREKADVYALGMLAWYLISQQIPATGQWYNTKLAEEVSDSLRRQANWHITSTQLSRLVTQCAQLNPEQRPTAEDFLEQVRTIWKAESFLVVPEDLFREEVASRVLDKSISGHGVSVALQREFGQPYLHVVLEHLKTGSEDWGKSRYAAQRAVDTTKEWLVTQGWDVYSRNPNATHAKLAAKVRLRDFSLSLASRLAADLIDARLTWNSKFTMM